MGSRASGDITELSHTHNYAPEIAPSQLGLALLNGGIARRPMRPLRYLELGFGQGTSLNIHAAACPGEYWGVDVNPVHVATARAMADASGACLNVLEDSFDELLSRQDLPRFDVIAANWIWSWASPATRAVITEIVRRNLADGGVFYLSYNCMPGWAPSVPLRHLMSLHADCARARGKGIVERIDGAVDFAQRLAGTGAGYFQANPLAVERLNALKTRSHSLLAHEFFNGEWSPMLFSDVVGLLSPAGLDFACSANLLHHADSIGLPPEARQLLGEIDQPVLRETARDYLINAHFRRDIFVKSGARRMPAPEQLARYLKQGFVLTHAADKFRSLPGGSQAVVAVEEGEITLQEDFYLPLIEVLAEGSYAPKTLKQLSAHRRLKDRPLPALVTALAILTGTGILRPTQEEETARQASPLTQALNTWLVDRPPAAGENACLASPLTGAGVRVSRTEMLFLQALRKGETCPDDWARHAWDDFCSKEPASNSAATAAREEKLAGLTEEAKAFAAARLPMLRALQAF